MRRAFALPLIAVFVGGPALAGSPSRTDAARAGAAWLAQRQTSSGSFGGDRADLVGDALVAAVAGGAKAKTIDKAVTYLRRNGADDAVDGAATGRILAGLTAADESSTALEKTLEDQYDAATGRFDTNLNQLFSGLLAANGWIAVHGDLPSKAVEEIKANACDNGGFGYDYGCARGANVDTTSWAINVLCAAGEKGSSAVRDARGYLIDVQRSGGGFPYADSSTLPTSSDSTGLALSAIEALGDDSTRSPWKRSGGDPIRALLKLQTSSGGFAPRSGGSPNLMSTVNATAGLAGFSYPVTGGLGPEPKATPKPVPAASGSPATDEPGGAATESDDDEEAPRSDDDRADGATSASRSGTDRRTRADGTDAPSGDDPVGATDGRTPAEDTGAAESFGAPDAGQDGSSSPFRSPVLWGGLGLAGIGTGFGVRWLRSRPR